MKLPKELCERLERRCETLRHARKGMVALFDEEHPTVELVDQEVADLEFVLITAGYIKPEEPEPPKAPAKVLPFTHSTEEP